MSEWLGMHNSGGHTAEPGMTLCWECGECYERYPCRCCLAIEVNRLRAQVRAVKKAAALTWDPLERPAAWDYYTVWKRLQAAINEALEVGDR